MPVKRRIGKRRYDEAAEAKAWRMMFRCGYDYLGDLKPLGYRSHEQILEYLPAAWQKFGAAFLQDWRERDGTREPWALGKFGAPRCQ